jgi:hypothetical protein
MFNLPGFSATSTATFISLPTASQIPASPIPPTATAVSNTGNVLLRDDFSNSKWGTGTSKDSSTEYVNQALQMIVYTKNWFVWTTPNDKDYKNVHIEVTVINHDTDSTTAIGILCNQQTTDSNYYYAAITPAGEYAIARTSKGNNDVFLTNNDQWATSDKITKNASSYRVGMDCGNGTLALYVDGQQIASVSDTAYTIGKVGVFTWSGVNATNTDVSFDDFLVTSLE